ncbi:MAG: sigma-54 dependent transcriptional regulator [Betaproteobacteria bacterium]
MAQILVVDDEMGIRELLSEILSDEGHDVCLAENATVARAQRARARPDLVLLDIWMPDTDGISLLKEWAAGGQLTMPVVMMSGHATIDTAVEATRIGALDFLEKPIALQKLLATVKRALRLQEGTALPGAGLVLANLGRSTLINDLRRRLAQLAGVGAPLLLRGEAGAMPELYARALLAGNAPFVVATARLDDPAHDLLQEAAGGILFVEELLLLNRNQQKHLATLATRSDRHNVRLVSFTAVDPAVLVGGHAFDAGLLARMGELSFALPALRQHAEDIPDIAAVVLAQLVETKFCPPRRFSTAALNSLRNFAWPRNLEELQQAVKSIAITALGDEIGPDEVEQALAQLSGDAPDSATLFLDLPLREAREAFERAYFEHHLGREQGSIIRVAEKSGLERTHLYRKLKTLGIAASRKDDKD